MRWGQCPLFDLAVDIIGLAGSLGVKCLTEIGHIGITHNLISTRHVAVQP